MNMQYQIFNLAFKRAAVVSIDGGTAERYRRRLKAAIGRNLLRM